jgi:hypothetical protein
MLIASLWEIEKGFKNTNNTYMVFNNEPTDFTHYILGMLKKNKDIDESTIEKSRDMYEKDRENKKKKDMEYFGSMNQDHRKWAKIAIDKGLLTLESAKRMDFNEDNNNEERGVNQEEIDQRNREGDSMYDAEEES